MSATRRTTGNRGDRASGRSTLPACGALLIGAVASWAAAEALRRHPPGGAQRWTRTNHAGHPVTLLEGPAYAVGAVAGAVALGAGGAAVVSGLGSGALGAFDDLAGDGSSKGLRGHLAAAGQGELTTGLVKIVGLGLTGLWSARMVDSAREPAGRRADEGVGHMATHTGKRPGSGPIATLVGGAVIAGSANLVNLLDLRPGRALKVVLLLAVPIIAGGHGAGGSTGGVTAGAAAGAALAAMPDDLSSRSMLGDTGANSAGALLGTALVARTGLRGRLIALAGLSFLTLASEKVSFTKVIESTPGLRELDALGRAKRCPAAAAAVSPSATAPVTP